MAVRFVRKRLPGKLRTRRAAGSQASRSAQRHEAVPGACGRSFEKKEGSGSDRSLFS
jgi:hypothetical protein